MQLNVFLRYTFMHALHAASSFIFPFITAIKQCAYNIHICFNSFHADIITIEKSMSYKRQRSVPTTASDSYYSRLLGQLSFA